ELHAHVIVTSREDRAFDLWFRGLVRPHRIDSDDGWHEREDCTRSRRQKKLTDLSQIRSGLGIGWLALFHLHHFAALVVATLGAGAMRLLFLVAVRALAQAGSADGVVRAALRGARLRMASFWIRHCSTSFS